MSDETVETATGKTQEIPVISNLEKFIQCYKKNLRVAVEKRPGSYGWHISEFDTVFKRMEIAIKKESFNKESSAFKLTCRELGIKHTYKAIGEFIK